MPNIHPSVLLLHSSREPGLLQNSKNYFRGLRPQVWVLELTIDLEKLILAMFTISNILDPPIVKAVIIADPCLIDTPYDGLINMVLRFVRHGGSVVLGGYLWRFDTSDGFPMMNIMMEMVFNCPWRFTEPTTLGTVDGLWARNPASMAIRTRSQFEALEESWLACAMCLSGVPTEEQVYLFRNLAGEIWDVCPAAFGKYFNGYMGYIGDMGFTDATRLMYIAMCRL